MVISPADRHGDADRLRSSGFWVIVSSQVQSTVRQVIEASPAAVVVEFVPALARETLGFVAQLAVAFHRRGIPLLVYGADASHAHQVAIHQLGAHWVRLGALGREELAVRVRDLVPDHRPE
jgi:hypothetical protein